MPNTWPNPGPNPGPNKNSAILCDGTWQHIDQEIPTERVGLKGTFRLHGSNPAAVR